MKKIVISQVGPMGSGKGEVFSIIEELLPPGITLSAHRFSNPIREALDLLRLPQHRANQQLLPQLLNNPTNIAPNPSAWVGSPTTLLTLQNIDPIVQVFNVFGIPTSPKNLRQFVLLLAEPTRPEKRHLWEELSKEEVEGVLARTIQRRAIADKSPVVGLDGVRWLVDETMIRSFPPDILSILVYTIADPDIRFNRVISAEREGHTGESNTTREEFDLREKANNEIYIPQIGSRADYTIENDGTKKELREKVADFYKARIEPALALIKY